MEEGLQILRSAYRRYHRHHNDDPTTPDDNAATPTRDVTMTMTTTTAPPGRAVSTPGASPIAARGLVRQRRHRQAAVSASRNETISSLLMSSTDNANDSHQSTQSRVRGQRGVNARPAAATETSSFLPPRTRASSVAAERVRQKRDAERRRQERLNEEVDLVLAQRRMFETGAHASIRMRHALSFAKGGAGPRPGSSSQRPIVSSLPDPAFGELIID